MAYLLLYPGKARWAGPWRTVETLMNYFFIAFGFYILGAGTYVRTHSARVGAFVTDGVVNRSRSSLSLIVTDCRLWARRSLADLTVFEQDT